MKRIISMLLAVIMCITCSSVVVNGQRDITKEEVWAQELKDLGLFRGVSETDFDLDRAPSRVEALVMLIRVLGKESEVIGETWKHPFSDVPGWADNYVGYAYSKGLTNGQSATQFGTGEANAAMYLTFVLRALGYSDANGKDFDWKDPYTLSRIVGILNDDVNTDEFLRADVVLVSHYALSAYLKGSQQTLAQKLISSGVFTQSEFDSVCNKTVDNLVETSEITAEEIYAICSPAVFYIEICDENGKAVASGSGFFIDDNGTAVTNYHVIDEAYSATVQVADTQAKYDVLGVYDYSVEYDWAVIKVGCTGNKYLDIDDASSVAGGASVYAIGSPLGLQNTITEGIVSNPARVEGDITYIQTNAAISSGSSGGALLNKKGKVIAITSGAYTEGQNLNLALPITYLAGFNKNEVSTLESLFLKNRVQDEHTEHGDSRKQIAFSLLKEFVLKNGEKTSKTQCDYSEKIVKEDGTGFDRYVLSYDSEDDILIMRVTWYYDLFDFTYYFSIEPNYENTFAMYWFYSHLDNGEDLLVSKGEASFNCSEFNQDYGYRFYEYQGDEKEEDQAIAKDMHDDGLNFVNYLFYSHLSEIGEYDTEDLGYTTYYKFAKNVGSEIVNPSINYHLSSDNISLNVGDSRIISFNYTQQGLPGDVTLYLEVENESIAHVKWADLDDNELPWEIEIKGVTPGTTYLRIYNDYNEQDIKAKIVVNSLPVSYPVNSNGSTSVIVTNPDFGDPIYAKFASAKFPLHLYSNDGKTYLGKLTTNKYDSDSISNTYGSYGSKYSRTSIFNEYGTYGSKYNSQSAFNEYATSPPIIVDSNGDFIAYLTANEYKAKGITYIKLLMYLEKFNQ